MVAMAVALMLGAAGLVLAFTRGGVGDLPADELRATYPTYDEVASWDFMAGEYGALLRAGADPKLVFGSSELKSRPAGPAHPARLFGDGRYGATSVINSKNNAHKRQRYFNCINSFGNYDFTHCYQHLRIVAQKRFPVIL